MNAKSNEVDSMLRLPAVIQLVSLSRTTIYELSKTGEFPKPIKLSARAVAWSARAIYTWIEQRKAASEYPAALAA